MDFDAFSESKARGRERRAAGRKHPERTKQRRRACSSQGRQNEHSFCRFCRPTLSQCVDRAAAVAAELREVRAAIRWAADCT